MALSHKNQLSSFNDIKYCYKTKMCYYGEHCKDKNTIGLCLYSHTYTEMLLYQNRRNNNKNKIYTELKCKIKPVIAINYYLNHYNTTLRRNNNLEKNIKSIPINQNIMKYRACLFEFSLYILKKNIPIEIINNILIYNNIKSSTFKCKWCSKFYFHEDEKHKGWNIGIAECEKMYYNRTEKIKKTLGNICYSCYNNKIPIMCCDCNKLTSIKHIHLKYDILKDTEIQNIFKKCNCNNNCHNSENINKNINNINNKCDDCLLKYWEQNMPTDFPITADRYFSEGHYQSNYNHNEDVDENCCDYICDIIKDRIGSEKTEEFCISRYNKYYNNNYEDYSDATYADAAAALRYLMMDDRVRDYNYNYNNF